MMKSARAKMRARKVLLDGDGRSDEAGDTLVEVLLALIVLSLCGVALITAFGTAISSSATYRRLASVDTVMRSAEEAGVARIQQQTNPLYIPCGTDAQYTSEFAALPAVSSTSPGYGNPDAVSSQLAAPVGFTVAFTLDSSGHNVQYWNSATSQFGACVSKTSPELITITVTQLKPLLSDTSSFIVDDRGAPSTQGALAATPSAFGAGAQSVPVTVTGPGLNNNGSNLAVSVGCTGVTVGTATFNAPSSVSFPLSVASSAPAENNCPVTVTNGDGTTVTDYVIAIDPAPTVTAATSLAAGTTNGVVTVTGTGFTLGSSLAATFGPAANGCSTISVSKTQYLSATSLALTVSVPSAMNATSCDLNVINGDYGQAVGTGVFTTTPAETPTVIITSPTNGNYTNQTSPTFTGTATSTDGATITVKIYGGATATGSPVQTFTTSQTSGAWSSPPTSGLPGNAQYTAVASQSNSGGNTGTSTPVTFVIDTTKPVVTIAAPFTTQNSGTGIFYGNTALTPVTGTGGILTASPSTGQSADLAPVTVTIYQGATTGGTVVGTFGATVLSNGTWSLSGTSLNPQQEYTARATQQDGAGNVGTSNVVTFVIDTVAPVVTNVQVTPGSGHKFTVTFNGGTNAYTATTSSDQTTATVYVCTNSQYNSGGKSCVTKPTTTVTATLTSGSSFSTLATSIAAGTYYFTVVQSDNAGNSSVPVSYSSSVTI